MIGNHFRTEKNITEIGADLDETELDFAHFLDGCTNGNVVRLIKKKWKTNGTIFKLTRLRDDWNGELIHTLRENLASLIPYELSAIYKIYCFGNEDTEETAEVFSDLESFSEASNAVNGHILYVDGGILAYIGKQPK